MAKAQSPLLGYNTNVRHKGRVFHIQTEDSGIAKPHVITHVFADGGRVIKTAKTSYADLLEAPDLAVLVKKLMQEQHKSLFVALRDGQYDVQFEPAVEAPTTPMEALPPPQGDDALARTTDETPPPSGNDALPSEELTVMAIANDEEFAIEIDESQFIESNDALPTIPPAGLHAALHAEPPPLTSPVPAPLPPPVPQSAKLSGPWSATPLPRSSLTPVNVPAVVASSKPPPLRSSMRAPTVAPRVATGAVASVTPPARSAAPPAAAKAPPVFGERMVTERSLDEVILAYLAEELDDTGAR